MDEVLFHFSQNWEALQIRLMSSSDSFRASVRNASGRASEMAHHAWHGQRAEVIREKLHRLMENCQIVWVELKEKAHNIHPRELYDRFVYFAATEMTNSAVYFGIAGFVVGGAIGLCIGLQWQRRAVAPQRMRAVICSSYHGLDALLMTEDMQAPTITAPDEVIVQVKAASVDAVDIKICSGYGRALRKQLVRYNSHVDAEFPVILGRDCTGRVVEIGYQVSKFEVGDEVWTALPSSVPGTMSEFVVVSENQLSKKPKNLGFEGAATVPYSAVVTWNALVLQAKLTEYSTKGKRVLVHCGANAVGCLAIQLVKAWGGHVTTTVSARAAPLVEMLGADDILLYSRPEFETELNDKEKFDVIVNTTGGSMVRNPLHLYCKPEGVVVSTFPMNISSDTYGFVLGSLFATWIRLKAFVVQTLLFQTASWTSLSFSPKILDHFAALIEGGQIQPVVEKTYAASDAEVAFQHAAAPDAVGKVVLRFSVRDNYR